MNTIAIILGCLGCLSVGICLGVNLVSNNNNMARKLLVKYAERDKKISESLALLSDGIGYTILLSKEEKTKERLSSFKLTIDRLKQFTC